MVVLLFGITRPLSVKLQTLELTLSMAMDEVKRVVITLESTRSQFGLVMGDARNMARELNVPVTLPRTGTRHINHADPSDFYRTNAWEPFIDQMVQELKTRFPEDFPAAKLQGILSPHIAVSDFSNIIEAAAVYEADLPNSKNLRSDLFSWCQIMSSIVHPKKFHELFVLSADLPNVRAILKILMTLPATSCTAERA
ncbi:unnamed protein product, partial [Meganyctiphanes norvegica]